MLPDPVLVFFRFPGNSWRCVFRTETKTGWLHREPSGFSIRPSELFLRAGHALLLDAGLLAGQIAQVVDAGAANDTDLIDLDLLDVGRVERENALHADGEPNAYLLNFTSDDTDTCNAIFEKLLDMSGVATTSRMRDTQDTYMHSMERVDFVVVIIILAAAALAMVVLFNLSNINITERQRELATIKLLGFYDGEVSAYVYRENIVLTLFGILLGCFMGHWLHIYLVRSTEIDLMMFGRQTAPSAYVYAAILTALFSLLVNVLAHFRMKKIDMVESLKSAE